MPYMQLTYFHSNLTSDILKEKNREKGYWTMFIAFLYLENMCIYIYNVIYPRLPIIR